MKEEKMDSKQQQLNVDPKTEALLRRKGYTIEKKLNEGAFGQVFKGVNSQGDLIAVKVMDMSKVSEKFAVKFMPRELSALIGIHHDNVIYIYDIIKASRKIFIFMEFANGGDITGYLQTNGPIAESLSCYWFAQVTQALKYCREELGIAHRDIKIDNILLHNHIAKLTDFGFSRQCMDFNKNSVIYSETYCGTEPYYSPQVLTRKPYNAFSADIWAMGVTLFCMLNNKFPFHFGDAKKMNVEMIDPNFIKTRYIKKFPTDLRNIQERMFEVEESSRIDLKGILEHPWILRKGK